MSHDGQTLKFNRNVTLLTSDIDSHGGSIQAGCGSCGLPKALNGLLAHRLSVLKKYQMHNRRLADLERRTLVRSDGHGLLIPSKQFWYEHNVRTVWWDLDLLYHSEVAKNITKWTKSEWCKNFQQRIAAYMPARDPVHGGPPDFIRQNWKPEVFIGILDDVNF